MPKASVQVDEQAEARTADTPTVGAVTPPTPEARPRRRAPFVLRVWRSAIVKKWVMGVTGIMLMGYVLAHLAGNLKVYINRSSVNEYAEWLRELGHPAVPHSVILWILRTALIAAFFLHILAAYQLTIMNRRARPVAYQSPRDYAAANFASRTMRWTGIIVGLFVIFHLLDLTWGKTGETFRSGDVYANMIQSLQRVPVAIVYMIAMIALGIHLYHGGWSLFQSIGWNNPRFNHWRRYFAYGFAAFVTLGNLSFPLLIVTGVYP